MNDLYEFLRHDQLEPDPALTQRVVDRWMVGRSRQRHRRRVLAILGPIAAAAVMVVSVMLVRHTLIQRHRAETGRAVALLIHQAQLQAAFQPQQIEDVLDQTTALLNPNRALALLLPVFNSIEIPLDPFSQPQDTAEHAP